MSKNFYSHLIEIDSITVELDELELSDQQKHHLSSLIDSNLHHTILDAILSQLNEEDKKIFLEHLAKEDHDKIWIHLNSKVDKIEDKIKDAANTLKEQIKKDIQESKKGVK